MNGDYRPPPRQAFSLHLPPVEEGVAPIRKMKKILHLLDLTLKSGIVFNKELTIDT